MTSRVMLAAVGATTFLAGFGLADLTGVRALGGLILLAGGVLCVRIALRIGGPAPAVALIVFALVLFVGSHPLGHVIGAWPAVIVSAALVAGASAAVGRRARRVTA